MFDNVRRMSRQLFAYGTADVMVLVVNFLLLPLYTRVLTPREYGALALLLLCEAFLKVVNRWGLDCELPAPLLRPPDRRGTQDAGRAPSPPSSPSRTASSRWCSSPRPARSTGCCSARSTSSTAYRLLVLNNFVGGFPVPAAHAAAHPGALALFASITFLRSFGTVLVRLLLVIGLRYGVVGLVLADVIITTRSGRRAGPRRCGGCLRGGFRGDASRSARPTVCPTCRMACSARR